MLYFLLDCFVIFSSPLSSFCKCFSSFQEKDSSYACELCQKNSKCIQPTSATEFDNSVEISEVGELEAVSTSDRTALFPLVSGSTMMSSIDFRVYFWVHSLNFD